MEVFYSNIPSLLVSVSEGVYIESELSSSATKLSTLLGYVSCEKSGLWNILFIFLIGLLFWAVLISLTQSITYFSIGSTIYCPLFRCFPVIREKK